MRSGEVVEALPVSELFLKIDIILVGEELIELVFISSVRAFDLTVELG